MMRQLRVEMIRCVAAAAALLCLMIAAGCGGHYMRVEPATHEYVQGLAVAEVGRDTATHFRVGPEDVLDIRVWGDEKLSRTVTVRPDGIVSLPLIGDVPVVGLSPREIASRVEDLLATYKTSPKVDVSITEINSYRIYLLGEVQKPGMIQVRNFTTLLQAIALAGGPTRFASNEILVLRKEPGSATERVLHIDFRMLQSSRSKYRAYNLVLWPGDTVIVK